MKKQIKIVLIALLIVAVLGIAYILGFLSFLNKPLNYIVYGPIDTSCSVDSDCVLRQASCSVRCACGTPVNKNWNIKCPFGYKHPFAVCEVCSFNYELKCVNNTCKQIFNRSQVLGIMK